MAAPAAELRLASTVLLVRDRPAGGVEVFMERRHGQSGFVGGAYVFPGGRVDPEDEIDPARCAGLDEATANARLGLSSGGLAHYVAAIRECFEEAGVLLAYDRSGALLDFSARDVALHYERQRARLNAGELTIADLATEEDLRLATDRIAYWAHWITPIGEPRRYDTRFFVTHAPQGQTAVHDDWELTHSAWVAPTEAMERAERGEWMIIFPTLVNLKSLAAHSTADDAVAWAGRQPLPLPVNQPRLLGGRVVLPGEPGYEQAADDLTNVDRRTFDRVVLLVTAPIEYDRVVPLSPLVSRITERNPGRFTGPGTNTHLVGRSSVFLLDPGEDQADGHFEHVEAAVGDRPVTAIIPSHGHPDHWPLAPRLAERFRAPIWFFGSHPGFRASRSLRDGETISTGGATLEVWHTPGHAADHLAFRLVEEGALFPGDLVMGWSTSIIAPPDGDLRQYLSSLERLLAVPGLELAYPAHGPAIAAPYDRIRELQAHRQERTRQALEALALGPSQIGPLVERIYRDTDPALHPAAARSLLAHLFALEAEGLVERAEPAGPDRLTWQDIMWRIRRETA